MILNEVKNLSSLGLGKNFVDPLLHVRSRFVG